MPKNNKVRIVLVAMVVMLLLSGCAAQLFEDVTVQIPSLRPPTQGYTFPESPYGPEDFVVEGGYLACTAGSALVGIDVSHHQGTIDWEKVAAAGIDFVFVRIGYRGYETGDLVADNNALENLQGARDAGLLVGAYFFSQAISVYEAQQEAAYALEIMGEFKLDLPLVYDWEYVNDTARTANVDRTSLTQYSVAFCEAVKNAGCEPMIYFSTNQAKNLLDMEKLERYAWWIAMYEPTSPLLCKVDAWQYTCEGSVDGISTVVDINLLFTDYGIGQAFAKTE